MRTKLDKKTGFLILGAVVILALILIFYGLSLQNSGTTSPVATNPTPSFAPQGQLVAGFPQSLLIDSTAQVANSYSMNYSSSVNQYTAQWKSTLSMTALYNDYLAYFPNNSWTITSETTSQPTLRALYATGASGNVNLVIAKSGTGSQVTLTYVAK